MWAGGEAEAVAGLTDVAEDVVGLAAALPLRPRQRHRHQQPDELHPPPPSPHHHHHLIYNPYFTSYVRILHRIQADDR